MENEKEIIEYDPSGQSGNIHYIFGKFIEKLGEEKFIEVFKEIQEKKMNYKQSIACMNQLIEIRQFEEKEFEYNKFTESIIKFIKIKDKMIDCYQIRD